MLKKQILAAVLMTGAILLTGCGGSAGETAVDTDEDVITETLPEENQSDENADETKEETETKKQQSTFTEFQKLTITEDEAPYYDASLGAFVIRFTDENVRYLADDACGIGISGDGEAYSIAGTIDMTAHPEFENGDYYTGIVVKPSEDVFEGTYTITITFDSYLVSFPCRIS